MSQWCFTMSSSDRVIEEEEEERSGRRAANAMNVQSGAFFIEPRLHFFPPIFSVQQMPTYAPLCHITSFLLYSETMTRALRAYLGFLMVHFFGAFFSSIVGGFFLTGASAAAPTACFFSAVITLTLWNFFFRGLLQFG